MWQWQLLHAAIIGFTCLASSVLLGLYIAARIPKLRDDADDERAYGDWPAIRPCVCDLNFPVCDSRACPTAAILPAEPQHAGGGGSPTGPRRPANSVRSSSHNPGDIR